MTPTPRHRPFQTERESLGELARFGQRRDAEQAVIEAEFAAKWPFGKALQASKDGDALPGGKFPIADQTDMNHAAGGAVASSIPTATVHAHLRKMAKKHGLKLPASVPAAAN